jgi:hypothetical protein
MVELVCAEVDKSKKEISAYPAEVCSAHKLLPNLTNCQNVCATIKPYFYELVNSPPSAADQLKFSNEIQRCSSLVDIWKLMRNIRE